MEIMIICLFTGIALGFFNFAIYESFGPNSENLKDPFEEHEE